ncbi:hypothetical protein GGH99_002260 [Coemansia sp. RSA 1285]|nr:hypothetical protein EV177_006139 [Coemansia sp. RSA 1804]KAJ2691652.1 hypothetical protein GGH99_002260 [Coemansia sp. RSA 1285]
MKFYISALALCAALAASAAHAQEINLGDALVNDIGDALVITNTAKPAPAATTTPAADAAVNSSPGQVEEESPAASRTQAQSFNSVPAAPEKEAVVTPVQNTANSAVSNDPVSVNGGNTIGKEDTASPSTQVANNDSVKESTGNDIAKDTTNDTAANSADSNGSQQNNAAADTAADTAADESNDTQALTDLADGATTDDTGVDVSVHMVVASNEESELGSDDDTDLELDSEESNASGKESDDDLSKHSSDEEETHTSGAPANTLASGFSLSAAFASVVISSALF